MGKNTSQERKRKMGNFYGEETNFYIFTFLHREIFLHGLFWPTMEF
jgi:hypothetical protein